MSKLIIGAIIGCFLLISAIAFFSFNDDKTDEANVKMLKQIKKVEEKVIDKAIDLVTALSGGSAWVMIPIVVGFATIVLGMLTSRLGRLQI